MTVEIPQGDLARTTSLERDREWPDSICLMARRGKKSKMVEITKEQYYGTGNHGAPMSGDWLLMQIDKLRREV